MGIFNRKKIEKREIKRTMTPSQAWFVTDGNDGGLCCAGYTRLIDCPEIRTAIERIAEIISTMTIHLMKNTEDGDKRIINELSKKIDITPNHYMSRQALIHWIVKKMLIDGNAICYVKTKKNLIDSINPLTAGYTFVGNNQGYEIRINDKKYKSDELLHFKYNPNLDNPWLGDGYTVTLRDIAQNLKQAGHTTNEFMSNRVIPNLIVKVDALTDDLASADGRAEVYDKFVTASRSGEPWIIPSGLIDVQQVKPLTLNDIAIKDTIELSKTAVASILGVPKFLLGIGEFNNNEYNNFIRTRIMGIAKCIEQELTAKLLLADDLYFKFNARSIYSYNLQDLSEVYLNLYQSGIVTGNEVRDVIGLTPLKDLNELTILENYIPQSKIGNQKKLEGGETNENETNTLNDNGN